MLAPTVCTPAAPTPALLKQQLSYVGADTLETSFGNEVTLNVRALAVLYILAQDLRLPAAFHEAPLSPELAIGLQIFAGIDRLTDGRLTAAVA